jgi:transposase
MFVEVCARESGSVTYIAELTGMSKETVRKQLKAANAGKSGRSRPRQKAREDLIPKLRKYLIASV